MNDIHVIQGKKPGYKVGVIGAIHGDESVGIAALDFLKEFFEAHDLNAGELYLITGNPKALNKNIICIDDNLNRMFNTNDVIDCTNSMSYEYKRSRELMPLLASFDYMLDIHSTNQPGPVFSIIKKEDMLHKKIASLLPVDFYTYNWNDHITNTTCDWVNKNGGVAITIECGDHTHEYGSQAAIKASKIFLQSIQMHNFDLDIHPIKKSIKIIGSEYVQDKDSFAYCNRYNNFQNILPGEQIAQDNIKKYITPYEKDLKIIFPTKIESIKSGSIKEAYLLGKISYNI
jgi:succinylglutamate desuccinylase